MKDYLRIFFRGFSMVVLVSANTFLISHYHVAQAGIVSTAVSVIWFYNARRAATSTNLPLAGWVYGLGAGVGTMVGMVLANAIWGGR